MGQGLTVMSFFAYFFYFVVKCSLYNLLIFQKELSLKPVNQLFLTLHFQKLKTFEKCEPANVIKTRFEI